MIRLLLCLSFVLLGAISAPYLLQYKGYAVINIGLYTIETTTLALGVMLIICFVLLQVLLWMFRRLKYLFFDNMALPQKWRKRYAHDAILKGVKAFAESDWSKAEKLLAGHAKQSEMPVFNYLAAAHAAHLQHNFNERDRYLTQASEDPDVQNMVQITKTRYLLEQDMKKARQHIDTLEITEHSSPTELKLAWFTYSAQSDYLSLLPLLDAMKWHKIIDKATYKEVYAQAQAMKLFQALSFESLQDLWSELASADKRNPLLKTCYVQSLNRFDVDQAKKYIATELKHKDPELLEIIPQILHWETDEKVSQHLMRLYKRDRENLDLVRCIARLCLGARLFKTAQEVLLPVAKKKTDNALHLMMLGEACEQLNDHSSAMSYYKSASIQRARSDSNQSFLSGLKTYLAE
tara:strand:- start:18507 stop:19724 length:1218 start_codon:yes stop_codon:yes gene_type:complete